VTEPLWTDSEWTFDRIHRAYDEIEKIGLGELGLNVYKNQIEIISSEQMLDAYTSIGMPIYYNHWSFGKSFAREWENYKSGKSGLAYELVINSNPCINYLMEENTMMTQALVTAHAGFGHNHFFKNNYLFKTWTDADAIVDYLVFARDYIMKAEQREGREAVETFLDSCHALMDYGVNRYKRPSKLSMQKEKDKQRAREEYLQTQVDEMYRIIPKKAKSIRELRAEAQPEINFPAQPEENLLYFFEKNAPSLKPWQRELIRIVRKMAQYFYPQGQTKVANEGFASWTHYTIMNRLHDKGLTTDGAHMEFLALHSNVVYQPNWNDRNYSGMNPYKLGFEILRDIERICRNPTEEDRAWFPDLMKQDPVEVIKDAAANYRDESFIRQFLSPKVIRDFGLFQVYDDREEDHYLVKAIQNEQGYQQVRTALADQYEREIHVPHIEVAAVDPEDRTLYLEYKPLRGRELTNTKQMLRHVRRLWGYTVVLHDTSGGALGSE
jgi:stage V sporulation protein R